MKLESLRAFAKTLEHKVGVSPDDWDRVHPCLLLLMMFVHWYAVQRALPVVITSVIRPGIEGVSVSTTHEEGRAFDMSVRGWKRSQVDELVQLMNRFFKVGAISKRDSLEREAVYENGVDAGTAPHIHCQVRADATA